MKNFKIFYEEENKKDAVGSALEIGNQFNTDISVPKIKFDKYNRVVLSKKIYSGKYNNIECKLIKFKNEAPYEIEISLLNDPNVVGKVTYKNGADAIIAFNSITNLNQCLKYMHRYVNNNESYKWQIILNDEGIGSKGFDKNVEPFTTSPSPEVGSPLNTSDTTFGAEPFFNTNQSPESTATTATTNINQTYTTLPQQPTMTTPESPETTSVEVGGAGGASTTAPEIVL